MEKNKRKISVIRYMFYLLIITFVITGVSFARYATGGGSSNSSARVAKLNVVVTHSAWNITGYKDNDVDFNIGTKNYTFTVENKSEVAVRVWLVVDGYDTYPSVTPSVLGNDWITAGVAVPVNGTNSVTITVSQGNPGYQGIAPYENDVKIYFKYEQANSLT